MPRNIESGCQSRAWRYSYSVTRQAFLLPLLGLTLMLLAGCGRSAPDPSLATTTADEVQPDPTVAVEPAPEASLGPDDWPWWRGPTRDGIAAETSVPVSWSATENIVWMVDIPGRGHSCPTIVGDRVFLATADEQAEKQMVLCLKRDDGGLLWSKTISTGGFPPQNAMHDKSTHATSTIASDGHQIYVTFLHHNAITATALDLEGEVVWEKEVGSFDSKFGYAPSPALLGDYLLIAGVHHSGGFLAALHRGDGHTVWLKQRPANASYSSPTVVTIDGRDQLLLSGANHVASYDPATGEQLWQVDGPAEATCATLVWNDGLVFASGGYPQKRTLAIRADGSGDIVWQDDQKAYVPSMLVHDGRLLAVSDNGIALCRDAATGSVLWKKRLGGDFSASPVLAGGHVYLISETGTCHVLDADLQQFSQVAENRLGDEGFSTPAICGGRIYLRSASGHGDNRQDRLYCIGQVD